MNSLLWIVIADGYPNHLIQPCDRDSVGAPADSPIYVLLSPKEMMPSTRRQSAANWHGSSRPFTILRTFNPNKIIPFGYHHNLFGTALQKLNDNEIDTYAQMKIKYVCQSE